MKLQSKQPISYNARNQSTGIIRICVSEWKLDLNIDKYYADVNDYLVENIQEDEYVFERLTALHNQSVSFDRNYIESLDFDDVEDLLTFLLINKIENENYYGTSKEEWEIL